jgi:hypothetical protein
MNNRSGKKVLSSGNVFAWDITTVGSRSALTGGFDRPPNDADIEEATAFAVSMAPKDADQDGVPFVGTREAVADKAVDYFTRNAKHN